MSLSRVSARALTPLRYRTSHRAEYPFVAAMEADRMRGQRNLRITMLAFVDLEERVPTSHPLRTIKRLADEALTDLSPTFDQMYAENGRRRSRPSGS